MKKNFKIFAIISAIVTLIGCVINFVCIKVINNIPPLALHWSGGEIVGSNGFGWNVSTIYPLTNDPINHPATTSVGFSIINLLVSFIFVFVVVSIIGTIIYFIRKGIANKQ